MQEPFKFCSACGAQNNLNAQFCQRYRCYYRLLRKDGDLKELRTWREGVVHRVTEEPRKPATINREMETHHIYRNIDRRLARVIADSLDKLHAEREKAASDAVTDGTGFVI